MPPFGQRPLVLKEGGVRLSFRAIRTRSYKTEAEDRQQGNAPYSSRGGCRFLLIVMTQMNTDILVDNLRNLRDNNLCALNDNYPNIRTLYAEKSKKLYKPLGNIKISL